VTTSLLQTDAVSFHYPGCDPLFVDVTLALSSGERAALVAPNGVGKSTLLKVLAGELEPSTGRVIRRRGLRVGMLRQSHEPRAHGDVLSALLEPFRETLALHEDLVAAHEAGDLVRIEALQARYESMGGYDVERRVSRLAGELGFSDADLARPVSSLSGGERGRLDLATVLVGEPELLLLDEPTNHLDLAAIERLESRLAASEQGMLIVSHDRAFLDATCPRIIELSRKGARFFAGPYRAYETEREAIREREEAAAERQREQIAKVEEFVRRNIAGQNTKQAQARRKALAKLERMERPDDDWADAGRIGLRFAQGPRTGDIVLEAKGLGARRGERELYRGLDLLLRRGERLAIVGPNGAGKSTLLAALALRQEADEGTVRHGTNVVAAVMDQHLESIDDARTLVEEIQTVRGDMNVDRVRQYLARFRFFGEEPFRKVLGLSGGERARLSLAKMLLVPRNLLFLDEPTNHLDIPACQVLEGALQAFDGTIVLVSHDRALIDAVATRILSIGDGETVLMAGGWTALREHRAKRAARPPAPAAAPAGASAAPKAALERPRGKDEHEEARRKAREAERQKRRFADLEQRIARAEERQKELRALLSAGQAGWEELDRLAREEQALGKKLEEMIHEWAELGSQA